MQDALANAFAAFARKLNITFDSRADFLARVKIFGETLQDIDEINDEAETYYVSVGRLLCEPGTCSCV